MKHCAEQEYHFQISNRKRNKEILVTADILNNSNEVFFRSYDTKTMLENFIQTSNMHSIQCWVLFALNSSKTQLIWFGAPTTR